MGRRDLIATSVHRGGRTARYSNFETCHVTIDSDHHYGHLAIQFSVKSKGGGTTDIDMSIGKYDFTAIVAAMVDVDREVAMAAISQELAKRVGEQPIHNAALIATGRSSMRSRAEREMHTALGENKATARFALETVNALIKRLEEDEKPLRAPQR